MDLNTLSLIVSIVGAIVSIGGIMVSVRIFLLSTRQLRNGIRTAFQMDVRKTINRIGRNKEKFKQSDPEAYKELFDIQDELETMSQKFLAMFGIKK